ncbi:MAG: NAD(P)H-dependent oxidoreductase [Hyphomicrobiales bacterium]|nr:NAD(P)H-dependent oxidoreductase [Hyphomicrobiales bacterium]MCC2108721.1 NAD(P)H-dependent oxidoreductase [Hyphomicrobiales bacterium]
MVVDIRKGMPNPKLDRLEFERRFLARFEDPAFDSLRPELRRAARIAWGAYDEGRKAPLTRQAGVGYADPSYDLSVDWLEARAALDAATAENLDPHGPDRVLLINASTRSEHTCPGEMSKTWRLLQTAADTLQAFDVRCDILDLARLASGYDLAILPCKACFSTSPALCHWPCSCYPNHSLAQVNDAMHSIYPMWMRAHGVMIVTPVHWYQAPTVLKSMMDRLVCADGGNPDPTTTHGKTVAEAKRLENGWRYPRHLAGRVFSVVVHGDAAGAEGLRRAISDWMRDLGLRPAGEAALLDRYIGYYRPYGASHAELDADDAIREETRNAARTLQEAVRRARRGEPEPGQNLTRPRPK